MDKSTEDKKTYIVYSLIQYDEQFWSDFLLLKGNSFFLSPWSLTN